MKGERTPQEKKQLSYERDRRGDYGNSNKGSRKSIPLHKRIVIRSHRRATKQQLPKNALVAPVEDLVEAEARVLSIPRKRWEKWPNVSLAEFIARQQSRAERREGRKTRSRESRS